MKKNKFEHIYQENQSKKGWFALAASILES